MEKENNNLKIAELVDKSIAGDKKSLEILLVQTQDLVFNLSLRMLGTIVDAEDATQDILVRIMTNLSSFRKESSFNTWVYRLSVNHLINYKKSMFAHYPLDFEYYGNDIKYSTTDNIEDLIDEPNRAMLAEELKMSCTNVMLQCLDAKSRCIFILGTMFKVDSRIAGEILDMSPDNYRQKLSRIRKKIAGFLAYYCGLTDTGFCICKNRVTYAISQNRLNPKKLEYLTMQPLEHKILLECKSEMEKLDNLSIVFEDMPNYKSPITISKIIEELVHSPNMNRIQQF